jgi:ketosteroid isomerase-like protein
MPITLIPSLFEAFNNRDEALLMRLADPDIVWDAPTAAMAGREGPYCGHDGLRDYLDDIDRLWEEMRATPVQVRMRGADVFVVGRLYARGRNLGIRDLPVAWSLTVASERCTYGVVHEDPRRAALAAGWLRPTGWRTPA